MLLLDENEDKDVPNPKEAKRAKPAEILLSEIVSPKKMMFRVYLSLLRILMASI